MKSFVLGLSALVPCLVSSSAYAEVELRIERFYAREQKILFSKEACDWVHDRRLSVSKIAVDSGKGKPLIPCTGANIAECNRYQFTCDDASAYVNIPDDWTSVYLVYEVAQSDRFRLYEMPINQPLDYTNLAQFTRTRSTAKLIRGLVPKGEPIDAMLDLLCRHAAGIHELITQYRARPPAPARAPEPLDVADYYALIGRVSAAVRELNFEMDELKAAVARREKARAQLDLLNELKSSIADSGVADYNAQLRKTEEEVEQTEVVDDASPVAKRAAALVLELQKDLSFLSNEYQWRPGAGT